MEKDGEGWTGNESSHLDFGARIYDSRLGRWFAIDPHTAFFPSLSPYQFAGNSPILMVDDGGNENMIYLYVDVNSSPYLKAGDDLLIYNKMNEALQRIYNENPQLKARFEVLIIKDPKVYELNLDITDALVNVISYEMAVSLFGEGSYSTPSYFSSKPEGETPPTGAPAVVIPPLNPQLGVSPNFIDQIAYSAVHEAFHNFERNFGYGTVESEVNGYHAPKGYFMQEGKYTKDQNENIGNMNSDNLMTILKVTHN
jgi:RHS repeat-associated protein